MTQVLPASDAPNYAYLEKNNSHGKAAGHPLAVLWTLPFRMNAKAMAVVVMSKKASTAAAMLNERVSPIRSWKY